MINLIPYKQKSLIKRLRNLRILNSVLMALIILSAIVFILSIPTALAINARHALFVKELHTLEDNGEIVKEENVTNLQNKVKNIKEKFAADLAPSPLVYMDVVRRNINSGITLRGFESVSDQSIQVHGLANKRQDVQQLVDTLEQVETVDKVDSPVSNYIKSTNSEFVITVTFKKT